jgi:hypothetical protein
LWWRAPQACGSAQPCCQVRRCTSFMIIPRVLLGSCSRDHFSPQCLALADAERERDDEPDSVAFAERQVRMRSISSASKGSTSACSTRGGLARATGSRAM